MTWENRFTFEVSSADPDSTTPVWVDFSLRILDEVQPIEWANGRQSALDQSEPGQLRLLLNNADGAVTFGNTTSPYAAWWGPGRLCRLREHIGQFTLDQFTGYIQAIEESVVTADVEQRVAITAVDRLGRLRGGRTFIGMLAEHVLYNGGSALKAFYPLNEPVDGRFLSAVPSTIPALNASHVIANFPGFPPTESARPVTTPAGGPNVYADDLPSYAFNPIRASDGDPCEMGLITGEDFSLVPTALIPQASGETVSFVFWMTWGGGWANSMAEFIDSVTGLSSLRLYQPTGVATPWRVQGIAGGTLNLTVPDPPQGGPHLVTMRMTLPSGLVEFWRNAETPVTGSTGGVPPASAQWGTFNLGFGHTGSLGTVQIYVGSTGWTYAQHLAQFQVGQTGLERQTTGERIRTIAQFAGVPSSQLTLVDTGTAVMRTAQLEGLDPLAAMRDAETAEQGLLYVDGSGNLVFADRRRLYNI